MFGKSWHGLNPLRQVCPGVPGAWACVLCMVLIKFLGQNNLNFMKGKPRERLFQPHLLQKRKQELFHSLMRARPPPFFHSFSGLCVYREPDTRGRSGASPHRAHNQGRSRITCPRTLPEGLVKKAHPELLSWNL